MKWHSLLILAFFNTANGQPVKLQPGVEIPGFISVIRYDSSRSAIDEQVHKSKGRVIQLNIWYPSMPGTKRICFKDYVELIGRELGNEKPSSAELQAAVVRYLSWPVTSGCDQQLLMNFLDRKDLMLARVGAKWNKKKYPLVILLHGYAADHAYLAEYIASFGYVVLQVPVKGTHRYELDFEGSGLATQVRDYEFAMQVVRKEFPFITRETVVVGFSFGAQSAAALAQREKSVRGIVSLDGGIGSAFGAQLLLRQPGYDRRKMTMPVLHLYNPNDPYTDLAWFDSTVHCNRYLAALKNMTHGHFTSFGIVSNRVPGLFGKAGAEPGHGYEAVMFLAKEFIHDLLKKERTPHKGFFSQKARTANWLRACLLFSEEKIRAST